MARFLDPETLNCHAAAGRQQASMSRPHAQIDLRRPFYSAEDEEDEVYEDENDQSFGAAEPHVSRNLLHRHGERTGAGMVNEDEEVDLEGYEQYLSELKSKAEARPHSARVVRTLPTESPQFYMVNAHNPSFPIVPPSVGPSAPANGRPTRPMSARPRLNTSGGRNPTSSSTSQLPRAPSRGSLAMGTGVRRRRQGDNVLNARVRAIYNETSTGGRGAPPTIRQMPSSVSANSTIANKLKVFQQAELHDEYYKLVDVVTELKTACQLEQERRVKAVARIRRLEEIVAMKDRKIEALLHAKSSLGSDHHASHSSGGGVITQRELAHKDRQNNALVIKLKHKIAQQSQLLSSYEEAMQSLRSGVKSTNLMELEEERGQLYIEIRNQQELLACARLELESQNKKITELSQIDAHHRQQIVKTQQEARRGVQEKQKCDQEIAFFKARVEQLQDKLTLEQRKRSYDREVSSGNGAAGGCSNNELLASPLSSHSSVLASALEEMKALMKKECMASIQREKLKSPRPGALKSPRCPAPTTTPTATADVASVAAQSPAQPPAQRQTRLQSADPTRPHRTMTPAAQSKPLQAATPSKQSIEIVSTKSNTLAHREIERVLPSEQQPKERTEAAIDGAGSKSHSPSESVTPTLSSSDARHPVKPSEQPTTSKAVPSASMDSPVVDLHGGLETSTTEPKEPKAVMIDTVDSKNEAKPISQGVNNVENHCCEEETHPVNEFESAHPISSPPSEQQPVGTNKTPGHEPNEVDPEEQNRQKIAEVSRLLQEMGDDEDTEVLLASDLSEDFLEIAELQRELRREPRERQKSCSSSFSSSSSSSEAGSPLSQSLLQAPAAQEEGLEASATHALLDQSEDDDDRSQGCVTLAVASASGSAELIYDSDFTENDDDDGDLET